VWCGAQGRRLQRSVAILPDPPTGEERVGEGCDGGVWSGDEMRDEGVFWKNVEILAAPRRLILSSWLLWTQMRRFNILWTQMTGFLVNRPR
jgi:hypothetical protein